MSRSASLTLLREAPLLRRWLAADAVCMAGDWFTYIAMSTLGSDGGRSPEAVLAVLISQSLPRALCSPLAGYCADRFDRRTIALFAHAARALLVLAMALCARRHALAALHALHFARMSLGAFADAANRAALPALVKPEQLSTANSLTGTLWSLFFAAGVLAGGLTVAHLGAPIAFLLDAASYLFAAVLLLGAARVPPTGLSGGRPSASWSVLWRAFAERPALARLAAARVPTMLTQGAGFVVLTLGAQQPGRFAHGAVALGGLHLVRGVGTAVGPWALRKRFAGVVAGAERWLWVAASTVAVMVALLGVEMPAVARVAVVLAWGAGSGASWVGTSSLLQRCASGALQGRLVGADLFAFSSANVLGAVLAVAVLRAGGSLVGAGCAAALCGVLLVLAQAAHARAAPLSVE